MLLLSSADFFFQNYFFQKILSGILSECQTVWIQIRADILSALIWVQTVCKGYQQTTKVATSEERVNPLYKLLNYNSVRYYSVNIKSFCVVSRRFSLFHFKTDLIFGIFRAISAGII